MIYSYCIISNTKSCQGKFTAIKTINLLFHGISGTYLDIRNGNEYFVLVTLHVVWLLLQNISLCHNVTRNSSLLFCSFLYTGLDDIVVSFKIYSNIQIKASFLTGVTVVDDNSKVLVVCEWNFQDPLSGIVQVYISLFNTTLDNSVIVFCILLKLTLCVVYVWLLPQNNGIWYL